MYLIYESNPYGADTIVGYVETIADFVDYCETLGLTPFKENEYARYIGHGYYTDHHYIKKITKIGG
jgi:hypothetical protein